MHPPVGLITNLSQGCQKQFPIRLVGKDGLSPISAIHHMTEFAHRTDIPNPPQLSILLTDPFVIPFSAFWFPYEAVAMTERPRQLSIPSEIT
jgi:hypothetical protein